MDSRALSDLAHRHGISLVVRFGSTVTGTTHPGSDVDIGLLFERFPETLDAELRAIADVQSLERGTAFDVTVLNRADPLLLKQVAGQAHVEYGTPERFDAFRRYAFKRYQDHRRFLELERQYLDRAVGAKR